MTNIIAFPKKYSQSRLHDMRKDHVLACAKNWLDSYAETYNFNAAYKQTIWDWMQADTALGHTSTASLIARAKKIINK